MALATPNQLYRLNKLGRLEVVAAGRPLDHLDADAAIKVAEHGKDDERYLAVVQEARSLLASGDAELGLALLLGSGALAGTQDAPSEL